jgi:hypothetical protein
MNIARLLRSILPAEKPVAWSELLTNPNFEVDGSGWTAVNCDRDVVAGGQSGNCLRLTATGGATQYAYQAKILNPGERFTAHVWVKSDTAGNESFTIGVVDNVDWTEAHIVSGTSSGTWTKYSITFIPTHSSFWFVLQKDTATLGAMLFDTASLRRHDYKGIVSAWISGGSKRAADILRGNHGRLIGGVVAGAGKAEAYDFIANTEAETTVGSGWVGSGTTLECLFVGDEYRFTCDGSLTKAAIWVKDTTNLLTFKLRVWRKNGTTYDLVGESEDISSQFHGGSGENPITLASPILGIRAGDYYGYRIEQSSGWDGLGCMPDAACDGIYENDSAAWTTPLDTTGKPHAAYVVIFHLYMTSHKGISDADLGWSFGGVNGYIRMADAPGLTGLLPELSMAAWVKFTAGAGTYRCAMEFGDLNTVGAQLFIDPDDKVLANTLDEDGGQQTSSSTAALLPNRWNHLAITFDGARRKLYINGVIEKDEACNGKRVLATGGLSIGIRQLGQQGDSFPFLGSVAIPFVAHRALSAEEIANFYRDTKGLFLPR